MNDKYRNKRLDQSLNKAILQVQTQAEPYLDEIDPIHLEWIEVVENREFVKKILEEALSAQCRAIQSWVGNFGI